MDENDWLAERFQAERGRLRGVAYRMLGSLDEAEDAVQDAWVRASNANAGEVDNLGAWLTTIVARVCLNQLRSRNLRREQPLGVRVPDPLVSSIDPALDIDIDLAGLLEDGGPVAPAGEPQPEDEAVLSDSVGLALLVVLDTLAPAERLAFVLHDMFDLPFEQIASVLGRTPAAARQLASRARRRVRGARPAAPAARLARQHEVVEAFLSAAREGDLEALVAVLDPDVVLRIDGGRRFASQSTVLRGATTVARQSTKGLTSVLRRPVFRFLPAVVNGAAGLVVTHKGRPITVMGFTIADDRIVEIDSIADVDRVARATADYPLPDLPEPTQPSESSESSQPSQSSGS